MIRWVGVQWQPEPCYRRNRGRGGGQPTDVGAAPATGVTPRLPPRQRRRMAHPGFGEGGRCTKINFQQTAGGMPVVLFPKDAGGMAP